MRKQPIAKWDQLGDRAPFHAVVGNTDLVVIRYDENVSVLYGRCQHRGALMSDGCIKGSNIICGLHNWDFRIDTGVSEYNDKERLHKFEAWREDGEVFVDADEIAAWESEHPQPYNRQAYQGAFADLSGTPEEPYTRYIQALARDGLTKTGPHGPSSAMGPPLTELPRWDDIQFVTAQLATLPTLEEVPVKTDLVIGPSARKPLHLEIPLFISDMSFGALSIEAKVALARGAEMAGTGICSGEGGMAEQEKAENSRYLYELASARFGFDMGLLKGVQAFHFKGGQAAKTGVGGHLPGAKVTEEIAKVRGLTPGEDSVSPSRFPDWNSTEQIRDFADTVREFTGGIPIGYKLSAQHIEEDIDAALVVGVDYIILDGRGGGTGSAPTLVRDHISVPTIPALARARRHLEARGREDVTLVITGGLRTPADFAKALALGADGIALSNAAMQAIGCLAMRACHTDNCPVGIATQNPRLRARLPVAQAAERLDRFLRSSTDLMKVLARACGHTHLNEFSARDLTTFNTEMARLSGVAYAGVAPA